MNTIVIYLISGLLTAQRYHRYTVKRGDVELQESHERRPLVYILFLGFVALFWLPFELLSLWERCKTANQ